MESSASSPPILFEEFLVHLRRLGFHVGIEQHLRVQQLVASICGECSPEDLKTLLCPLFAANEKQQDAFYRAFDTFFPLLSVTTEAPGSSAPALAEKAAAGRQPRPLASRTWLFFSGAAVLLALLIAIAAWKSHIATTRVALPATVSAPPAIQPQS